MDVEVDGIPVTDPAAAHVGLVRQQKGRGDGVHRKGGGIIVMADGCDDGGHIGGLHAHVVQDPEGHYRSGLGVVVAVDHVADVMHKGGDPAQLHRVGVVTQLLQQVARHHGAPGHVGKAVLGVPQGQQGGVRLGDISPDLLGLLDGLIGDMHMLHLLAGPII